jgi:hypothetical protein
MVPPLATLTTFGTVLAATLSIILAIAVLMRVIGKAIKLPARLATIGGLAMMLARPALFGLLLLVWNTGIAPIWVIVALVLVQHYFVFALVLPGTLVDVFLIQRFVKKLYVDVTHRTWQLTRDYEAGKAQRKVGNLAIADLIEKAQTSPPLEHRLFELLHLAYIPLLIALWLS